MLDWEKADDNHWYATTSCQEDCDDGEVWRIEKHRHERRQVEYVVSLFPQSPFWTSSTLEGAQAVAEHYEHKWLSEEKSDGTER